MPEPLNHHDKPDKEGNRHPCLSEVWLIDNLPEGWNYDCHMGEQFGFLIYPPKHEPQYGYGDGEPEPLFIPLDLLKLDRNADC